LIVVIAIVGILSSIGIPAYYTFLEKAKITRVIAEMRMLEKEILLWEASYGSLPTSLEEIGRGGFLDPWGNPYQYLNFSTIKGKGKGKKRKDHMLVPINDFFDLYSKGKDGKSASPLTAKASHDDIIRGHNGQYIGLASEYT
jgi:general secretion pathway protein G